MPKPEAPFDKVGEQFLDYYKTVRGHVRQAVVRQNLEPFLTTPVSSIADVGGGDARDAIWLAGRGHKVTVVDTSAEMMVKAQQNINQQEVRVRQKIKLVCGNASQLLEEGKLFDIVLSHGVLMYLDNPQEHVDQLVGLTEKTGIISLLTKGYQGALNRLDSVGKYEETEWLKRTGRAVNNLGLETWAFKPEQVEEMLQKAGAYVVQWSGVRIATDSMRDPIENFTPTQLRKIVEDEHQLGQEEATKASGQMLHFIARKKS